MTDRVDNNTQEEQSVKKDILPKSEWKRIHIYNLPPNSNRADVAELCGKWGRVKDVQTKRSKGRAGKKPSLMAFVTYNDHDDADFARYNLHDKFYRQHYLSCYWMDPKEQRMKSQKEIQAERELQKIQRQKQLEKKGTNPHKKTRMSLVHLTPKNTSAENNNKVLPAGRGYQGGKKGPKPAPTPTPAPKGGNKGPQGGNKGRQQANQGGNKGRQANQGGNKGRQQANQGNKGRQANQGGNKGRQQGNQGNKGRQANQNKGRQGNQAKQNGQKKDATSNASYTVSLKGLDVGGYAQKDISRADYETKTLAELFPNMF